MSIQAVALGNEGECAICGAAFIAEFAYQQMGVCRACTKMLAHYYVVSHGGDPDPRFAPPESLTAFYEAKKDKGGRERITNNTRTTVFERDAYRCKNCGDHHNLQVDHIIPVSAGGTADLDNLQTLCRVCNGLKGAKSPEEWRR